MSRTLRLFEIVNVLREAGSVVTADTLGSRLGVSRRTIYRDITALRSLQVPVEGEAGVGYELREAPIPPRVDLTPEESDALRIALALLTRTGDPTLEAASRSASTKLGLIGGRVRPSNADRSARTSLWNDVPAPTVDLRALRRSIRDERKVLIRYADGADRLSERVICPLLLIYYVGCIVIVAWCDLREDFRHFRADRIRDCTVSPERFLGRGPALRRRWEREQPEGLSALLGR